MRLLDELRRRWWLVPILVLLLVLVFGARLATFYTDVLWFSSVGFLRVFSTRLLTGLGLAAVGGALVTVLVAANLLLARRLAPPFRIPSPQEEAIERYRELLEPFARTLLLVVAVAVGILSALAVTGEWDTFQLWANATPFGRQDPQFGLDLGFFVFRLPFWSFLNSWLFTVLAFAIVLTALAHYVFGGIRPQSPGQKISPQATVHLSLLLAALVAVRAWGFWLDRYQLSYSTRGVVHGLSYTDANAQLRALELLTVIAVVCVLLFLVNLRFRNFLLPSAGVGILLVAAIVLSGIYPAVIQRVQVEPQELERERPFIARNLELTRFGYNLVPGEHVSTEPFAASAQIDPAEVADNSATLESIRLWDPAVLGSVYTQLQGLRRYFQFPDVDVDRYDIDGEQQQVNVAVRELNQAQLPDNSWQNRHLVYTHGFGYVASDVSAQSEQGQPEFLVRDIPPDGAEELEIEQPRVYFGEQAPLYSIVRTDQPELDFLSNEEEAQAFTYDGRDGVNVAGPLRRLAFAFRYSEPNFVLSSLLNGESRVLLNRAVDERVAAVAPFLQFDSDPYSAVVDGRIKWILDAYTLTDMLPYSQRRDLGALTLTERTRLVARVNQDGTTELVEVVERIPGLQGQANYLRNSVKAVVDAYDGTVELYVADPEDPIIRSWQRVFPDAFRPLEDASEDLRAHFRYPEDLFRVQADVYTTYHIPEADAFYTRDDAWSIPRDAAGIQNLPDNTPEDERDLPLRPYYLQLRLPGEEEEEFALIQPFNPLNRQNLIAWTAARSDPEHYGELRTYLMPATENVLGTEQLQAQINQDPTLAPQISLLDQAGSRVIYGNLLIIPIEDSLLYAQPLFVRSEQTQIPELRFVVLSFGGRVVAEATLPEALAALFGETAVRELPDAGGEPAGEAGGPVQPGVPLDPRVADLIEQALDAFTEAEQALADGDLGAYQAATGRAQDLLEQAQTLTDGAPAPTPTGEPTPAG
jgi:uncharacterized membrane protein (UPF0182 family)